MPDTRNTLPRVEIAPIRYRPIDLLVRQNWPAPAPQPVNPAPDINYYLAPVEEDYDELLEVDYEAEPIPQTRRGSMSNILTYAQPVYEVFNKKPFQKDKSQAVIGLELENESIEPVDFPQVANWRYHAEGSLRYCGMEYVLTPPLPIDKALINTQMLLKSLSKISLTNSHRTSVHVHFDVTHYKFPDIANFAAVYWLMEDILSDFAGAHRKNNLFCLRMRDAKHIISGLVNCVQKKVFYHDNTFSENQRYGSINLNAIPKFGSLEFRMMRGTDKYEDIATWVEALNRVRLFALKFATPKELRNFFLKEISAEDLPEAVFGDILGKLTKTSKETQAETIRESFLFLEPFLLSGKSWDYTKEIAAEKERVEKEQAAFREHQARQMEAVLREREERARRAAVVIPALSLGEDHTHDQYNVNQPVSFDSWSDE